MSMNYNNKDFVENLISLHSTTLVRFLARRMNSREDAEDIAQAAFIRLYTLDDPEQIIQCQSLSLSSRCQYVDRSAAQKSLAPKLFGARGAKAPMTVLRQSVRKLKIFPSSARWKPERH